MDTQQEQQRPYFSFGVCSDLQYADIDNRTSYHGNIRYYRNSVNALREAIKTWNEEHVVSFLIHLGDIIDGFAKQRSAEALDVILKEFAEFKNGPVYHLLGNHELYHLKREYLLPKLGLTCAHYEFSPHSKFRFVVLDPYDISILGREEGHPHNDMAKEILEEKNPNTNKDDSDGIEGHDQRYVKYNGGISDSQLAWLKEVLEDATTKQQKVILCSHVPLHPEAGSIKATLWNYKEVLDLVEEHPCVVLVLSGHDHAGGYTLEGHVHHYVFEAVVETPPHTNAYSCMDVYDNRITMKGFGKIESRTFYF